MICFFASELLAKIQRKLCNINSLDIPRLYSWSVVLMFVLIVVGAVELFRLEAFFLTQVCGFLTW